MPESGSTFDAIIQILQSVVWFFGFLGSYLMMAIAVFVAGWFVWRFVNDVLFP